MKNFARLVRYALPYKVRFGLSICCGDGGILFFTELGAVYPLLHILFDEQNPQGWIAKKMDSIEDDVRVLEARKAEAERVQAVVRSGRRDYRGSQVAVPETEGGITRPGTCGPGSGAQFGDAAFANPAARERVAHLERLRHRLRLAEACKNELAHCSTLLARDEAASIDRRLVDIDEEIRNDIWWRRVYTFAQPSINRYLPATASRACCC